ncbi:MAG: pilus (MSHA type) biogenesis protein MshL [Gammaproteobacteria bacterium]|nr:pilus (MSHA type) biogenesis protein MshL [Gammaproteobacteria bacterium]
MHRNTCLLLLCSAALLTACAHTPALDSTQKSINKALEEGITSTTPPPPPPAAVSNALLPQVGPRLPSEETANREERFDISVQNAAAHDFFMSLVKDTPYNMVVSPDVTGSISLTLKNTTVPEVMDTVRKVYGYEFQRSGNTYMVLPAAMRNQIFQVNYLDFIRKGESLTRVTSGESTNNTNPYGGGGGYGYTPPPAATGGGQNNQTGTEVTTKTDSDFWKDLQASLTAIIGNGDGRRVVVDPDSGVVVVRAMPSELREVQQYLSAVQHSVSREVVLEAKIIEVTLNSNFQSGINWGALGRPGNGKSVFAGNIGGQSLFGNTANTPNGQGLSDLKGLPLTLTPGNAVNSFPSSAFGGTFALALNLGDFNGFIELLDTQGNVHVLSSPRVATINNQKAVIKVGSDEFFVTGLNSNTLAGASATSATSQNIILQPFFSGIALDVTPQIDADGYVTLHIHPTVSDVTDQLKNITFAGQNTSVPLAFSQVREADSVVRAQSGQIVVIGGLMKNQVQNVVDKTPFLSAIPLLGELFTQRHKVNVKSELVILLKPVVVENGRIWSDYSKQDLERIKSLENGGGNP